MSQQVVINTCFGGFGLSEEAYEWLITHGVPVRAYVEEQRGDDGRFVSERANEGRVIFDRDLTENPTDFKQSSRSVLGRYWETWLAENRSEPLLVQVVQALGAGHSTGASGRCAELKVVEVPDGVEWEIEEYDGSEHIAEAHRTWR